MFGHSEGTEGSKEHGAVADSSRCRRSFDARHCCSDEQSTPIHVLCISQSITGILQRRVLMEAAAVLFWIDPHVGDPPGCRPGRSLLLARMDITGNPEAGRRQLGPHLGHLCWHRHFSHLAVCTIDSARHKERVRANGMDLRTDTVTIHGRDGVPAISRLGVADQIRRLATAGADPTDDSTLPKRFTASTLPKFGPSLG